MCNSMNKYYFSFCSVSILILLLALKVNAQSGEDYISKGKSHYQHDETDSANFYYQKAINENNPEIQLQAVSGMIKVAILRAKMDTADSLVQIGDQLIQLHPNTAIQTIFNYKTAKGEFFRKNSQFDKALSIQQEVLQQCKVLNAANSESSYANVYADALLYTALSFERLGEYDSSVYYVDKAYHIFKDIIDTTSVKFAEVYNSMGVCYYRANRYNEAKTFYIKSGEIAKDKLGSYSSDLAICYHNLSNISRSEENYREGIQFSEKSLRIYEKLGDKAGASGSYYSLGVHHYFLGDYGRTKDYMEACIAIREKIYNKNHYSLIGPYEVLGIAYEESGEYEKTLQHLNKVRNNIYTNFGKDGIEAGYNYENTAICYKVIGELDSALYYIKLANNILSKRLPEINYSLATNHFNYGNILYLTNKLDAARNKIQDCMTVYEKLGLASSSEYAQCLGILGLIDAEEKKWIDGERSFQQAIDIVSLDNNIPKTSESFKMMPNALWVLNEYMNFLYSKYEDERDEAILNIFNQYADIYLDISDRFRKQFNDAYTKSILIKDNAEVYERNIGIYNKLYSKTEKEQYLKAAYNFSEYGRTCLLRDIQDAKILSYAGIPDSVIQQETTLREKVNSNNQQLLENPDSEKLKKALFESKREFNKFVLAIEKKYPKYHELKYNSEILSLDKIQSLLKKGENLIEYMKDDTAYYALVIRPDYKNLFYLGNRTQINNQISKWKQLLVSQNDDAFTTISHALYKEIWAPFEKQLDGLNVTVIPSGALFYLNFEALSPEAKPNAFLIYDFNISYALSFNIHFSEQSTSNKNLLLTVAPGFEKEIKEKYQTQLDTINSPDNEFLQTVRQPWSLKLANNLQKDFVNQAFIGAEATEANIKANIQQGNILYFGTHAIANSSDPLRSKLVLAKELGEQNEDGYLHAYELFGLPLQAELAILNACESGLGNLQKGEGMISLAYSIHYAGCPSTIMSLWKVDEKINTQITSNLLSYLANGYSKSEALRNAKLDYLNTASSDLKKPFYWGGMVLMGNDGQVQLENKTPWWTMLIIAGFVILMILYYIILKKKEQVPSRKNHQNLTY